MVAIVSVETVLLALLALLVAGLLRSHAEILRSLTSGERPYAEDPAAEMRPGGATEPADVVGTTLRGKRATVPVADGQRTLIAFLTSGCGTCEAIWEAVRNGGATSLPHGTRLAIVTKDRDEESMSRLRRAAPKEAPVVLSSAAWSHYGVPGAPYFVFVDGGQIRGEGSANTWMRAMSLVENAIDDLAEDEADAEAGDELVVVAARPDDERPERAS
jgi:hypothetical protein